MERLVSQDSFQTEQKIKKTSFDEANLQRIDVAEQQVQRYQEENEELESKMRSVQKQAEAYEVQAKQAIAQLEQAQQQQQQSSSSAAPPSAEATAQLAMLEKELQKIGEENEKLWSRVGRGEFDQQKFRVLTLGGGALEKERDLRTKRLDALKEENEALLQRVDELSAAVASAGGGAGLGQAASGGADWVPRASVETLQQELASLRNEIKMKDKAMLRLREVFQRKADEFNEAVRCLFGWKLKFLGSGKVKIVSDFSKGNNKTTLVFRPSDQGDTGDMRLTGEALKEGMADVQGLGEKWLRQDALYSIPCFLSEINQQLFESCTRARVMFGIPPPDDEDDA
jgi:mitotic spindle assembly checkpoint protein MAD1